MADKKTNIYQVAYGNQASQMQRLVNLEIGALTPDKMGNFSAIVAKYPTISKDLVMAMVKQGLTADTPGLGKIVSLDGITQLKNDTMNVDKIKSSVKADRGIVGQIGDAFSNLVYDPFKGVTRIGFAALRLPYDMATVGIRNLSAGGNAITDAKNAIKATTLGSLVASGNQGTGAGFFVSPESKVGKDQAKAMAAYGKIAGESFTIGRWAAQSLAASPDKTAYKIASGLLDATLNIALDPSVWVGPGSVGKIIAQGKKATALKEAIAPLSKSGQEALQAEKIAGIQQETKAAKDEAAKLWAKQYKRINNDYLKTSKEVAELETQKNKIMGNTVKKLLNTEKDLYAWQGVDKNAEKVLSPDNLSQWLVTHPKTQTGELTKAIDTLSADMKNTGGFFDGYLIMDEVPKAGNISVGAHYLDEYAVTVKGTDDFNLLDMAKDFKGASKEEITVEAANRAKLLDKIKAFAEDAKDVPAMQVFQEFSTALQRREASLEGFLGSLYRAGDDLVQAQPLGKLIGELAVYKSPAAMEKIAQAVQDIWKVDGFSNIRSIYGATGGVVITNTKRLAAVRAEIANAAAEIADPTNLGPNVAKLLESIKPTEDSLVARQNELDDIVNKQLQLEDHEAYVKSLRELANKDPEILREVASDPQYKGLKKIINLEADIAEKNALREMLASQVGITDNFAGNLDPDVAQKAMKFMLGRNFERIAEVVANVTDEVTLRRFFGRKLDDEMIVSLTAAKTADEVTNVFLNHLGAETTDVRNIKKSLSMGLRVAASPLAKTVDPVNLRAVQYAMNIDKAFNRFYVRGTMLNLGDLTSLNNGFEDWATSTAFGKVIGKKNQERIVEETQRAIFRATTNQERGAAIANGVDAMVAEAAKALNLSADDIKLLQNATKINGKEESIHSEYHLSKILGNDGAGIVNANQELIPMEKAILENQLLKDVVNLPDSRAVSRSLIKMNANMIYGTRNAVRVAAEELGDHWRTAQLVFRFSYIFRNIAEMQMRQFFSGHNSLFNSPLAFISMVMANPEAKGPMGQFAKRVGKYQYDITGQAFKTTEAEEELSAGVIGFRNQMSRQNSTADMRSGKGINTFKYYDVIGSEHPDFLKGVAWTVNQFSSDKFMPDVIRLMDSPEAAQRKYVSDLLNTYDEPNNKLREFAQGIFNGNNGMRRLLLNNPAEDGPGFVKDNINAENLFIYLFDAKQTDTVIGQLNILKGQGAKGNILLDLIRDGEAVVEKNGKLFKLKTPYRQKGTTEQIKVLEKEFVDRVGKLFDPAELNGSAVLLQAEKTIGNPVNTQVSKSIDWFFDLATRMETKINFGPEYQMSYWDFAGGYARMLKTDDLYLAFKNAKKSLAPITANGKPIGRRHPALREIQREIERRRAIPDYQHVGGVDLKTLDAMAAENATKYVKELFYDAARQKQWANSWRLVAPFAQAHYNTLAKWRELTFANPAPAVKFAKAYDALTKQGSNVLYDVTGMTYDDSQGFLYQDNPQDPTSPRNFKIPFAGSVIGAMAGKNINMKDALQITSPVQSLNLAFGQVNPGLPGIGPAAQLLYAASGKTTAFGPVNDIVRDIITPFGPPKTATDFIFPAWLKKTIAYRLGDETTVQRGVKDWASYLASSGEYGDNPLANDAERTRLFHDAESLSREVGFLSALFQSISPSTPSNEILAKIKTPENKLNFMTLTMLYKSWDDIAQKNPGDYGKSVYQFAEKFGASNLLVALGGSTSGVRGTADAWTFLNNNPAAADKYARSPGDVIPYFFPGGEYSLKYYNWQKSSGARRQLSSTELANEAEGMVYAMLKSQIADEQIANGYGSMWYTEQIAKLDAQFGGAKPAETITTGAAGERIAAVANALQDPVMTQSPVYKQVAEFYPKYKEFQNLLNKVKVSNYAELSSKGGMPTLMRNELVALAEQLMMENPAFTRMYYGVFAGQLEG